MRVKKKGTSSRSISEKRRIGKVSYLRNFKKNVTFWFFTSKTLHWLAQEEGSNKDFIYLYSTGNIANIL